MKDYDKIFNDLKNINFNNDSINANMYALSKWAEDSDIDLDMSKGFVYNARLIADELAKQKDFNNLNNYLGYLKTLIKTSN